MIRTNITFNEKVYNILADLTINTEAAKRSRRICFAIICVPALMFLFVAVYGETGLFHQVSGVNIYYLVLSILLFLMGSVGAKKVQRWNFRRLITRANTATNAQSREYEIDENGIHIFSDLGDGMSKWSAFAVYGTIENYLWILRKDAAYVLIDKNNVADAELSQIEKWMRDNNVMKSV